MCGKAGYYLNSKQDILIQEYKNLTVIIRLRHAGFEFGDGEGGKMCRAINTNN